MFGAWYTYWPLSVVFKPICVNHSNSSNKIRGIYVHHFFRNVISCCSTIKSNLITEHNSKNVYWFRLSEKLRYHFRSDHRGLAKYNQKLNWLHFSHSNSVNKSERFRRCALFVKPLLLQHTRARLSYRNTGLMHAYVYGARLCNSYSLTLISFTTDSPRTHIGIGRERERESEARGATLNHRQRLYIHMSI